MNDNFPVDSFWLDEDEAYIADVPDLKSCSAFADTPEEALREILVASDLWLEVAREHGKPLPDWRESKYLPDIAKDAMKETATP